MPARVDDLAEIERRLGRDLEALATIPDVPGELLLRLKMWAQLLSGTARCAEQETEDMARRNRFLRGKIKGLEQDRCERTLVSPQPN